MNNQLTDREAVTEQMNAAPITITVLDDPEDGALLTLENHFLAEIDEELMTAEKHERLSKAVREEKITFFIALQDCKAVGMCSVSKCFSTFSCNDIGVFDDFYIEPAFRKMGIARKLAKTAQDWCLNHQMASLTVCCAPCDEGMYQALGFSVHLGNTYTHLR